MFGPKSLENIYYFGVRRKLSKIGSTGDKNELLIIKDIYI